MEKALRGSAFSGQHLALKLVVQLQSKLDLSRIVGSIASGSNFAEVRIREVARVGDRDNAVTAEARSVEVGVIEDIKELRPELQGEALGEPEVLECGEV